MGTWLNSDGLYVKFGTDDAASEQQAGFICTYGPNLVYVLNLDLTNLTETETIQNDVLVLPKDAMIEWVEVATVTASATGAAIDVGLIANDRDTATDLNGSVTAADPDGILAAFAAATMSEVGEVTKFYTHESFPASVATGGALIGTTMTTPTLITASRTTSTAFTAGRVQIRIGLMANATSGFGQVH